MFLKLIYSLVITLAVSSCGGGSSNNSDTDNTNTDNIERGQNFVSYESGQVRALALTPDGNTLIAANTPNSSIEIFSVSESGLQLISTLPVGLEPVAIATPNNAEAWVINHLSDSISIVDLSLTPARIIKTINVGDEPRDIVFAGTDNKFALITTAHRGQNGLNGNVIDAEIRTPSVGRADVWVFDRSSPSASATETPLTIINLFGDTPRALAVSPDGNTVYAAVFLSGNKTTSLGEDDLAKAGPTQSKDGITQPDTGLIVQYNGTDWVDDSGSTSDLNGTIYNDKVPFSLPDYDVFEIDTSVALPVVTNRRYSGVGTVLFNMTVNPVSGALYVSNTEALNLTRFEGPGNNGTSVNGNFADSRITVIKDDQVTPVDLNPHVNFAQAGTQQERDLAITIPLEMAINSAGNTLYVAGFGAKKIIIYDTEALEANSFTPALNTQISLSAGGPSSIVLDEARNKLYVLTRFDNGISTIDTTTRTEIDHLKMYNAEPDEVIAGRAFLYDSTITSSHGTSSCALCHVFGDVDGLAWDLGNPDDTVAANLNSFVNQFLKPANPVFHPMKGPMTTQSFRGLRGNGPMHWRGDRTGRSASAGESLELAAFKDFNVAFPSLLGNDTELPDPEMTAYAKFALHLTYPPNPLRALDNSLNTSQLAGQDTYFNFNTTGGFFQCNSCHVVDPVNSQFGTSGLSSLEGGEISQDFKVPHLRNLYSKIGKFGNSGKFATDTQAYGEQIRGFGFMHDGGMDTLDKFLSGSVFSFDIDPVNNAEKRSQVVDFVMVMDSEMAPIVGQQITLSSSNASDVNARINLLRARALVTSPREECDLIVKGVISNELRGYLMLATGNYQSDKLAEVLSDNQLRNLVNTDNQTLTFTCVAPGSGTWMGIDHDEDGSFDRDEIDNNTDPLSSKSKKT